MISITAQLKKISTSDANFSNLRELMNKLYINKSYCNNPPWRARRQRCICVGCEIAAASGRRGAHQPIPTKRQQPSPWQRAPRGPIRFIYHTQDAFHYRVHQKKNNKTVLTSNCAGHITWWSYRGSLMIKIHTRRASRNAKIGNPHKIQERESRKIQRGGTDRTLRRESFARPYSETLHGHVGRLFWYVTNANVSSTHLALQPSGAAGTNQVLADCRSLHDCRATTYGRRPSSCCNPSGTDRKEARIPRRPSAGGERSPWSTLRYLTPSRRERPGRKYTGTRQLFCCALVPAAAACMCVCVCERRVPAPSVGGERTVAISRRRRQPVRALTFLFMSWRSGSTAAARTRPPRRGRHRSRTRDF